MTLIPAPDLRAAADYLVDMDGPDDPVVRLLRDLAEAAERGEPVGHVPVLTRQQFEERAGEAFHTAFRKAIDHPLAMPIHRLIGELPADDWSAVLGFAADGMFPEGGQ